VFDHVTIRVSERAVSERFYETVLRTLGAFLLDPDGNNVEVVSHNR
jgi:catechol-2,3-dioxygenase